MSSDTDTGKISDGYHTFDELYQHRHALFLNLLRLAGVGWKSLVHSDGTPSYDGWFLAGITLPSGDITYHLPIDLWDKALVSEVPKAPPFDGHTSRDVVTRLMEAL
jgi:hypothetical protein